MHHVFQTTSRLKHVTTVVQQDGPNTRLKLSCQYQQTLVYSHVFFFLSPVLPPDLQ